MLGRAKLITNNKLGGNMKKLIASILLGISLLTVVSQADLFAEQSHPCNFVLTICGEQPCAGSGGNCCWE